MFHLWAMVMRYGIGGLVLMLCLSGAAGAQQRIVVSEDAVVAVPARGAPDLPRSVAPRPRPARLVPPPAAPAQVTIPPAAALVPMAVAAALAAALAGGGGSAGVSGPVRTR